MKAKPLRASVERYYAAETNTSVERAHLVLAHNKQLYKSVKEQYEKTRIQETRGK